MAKHTQGKLIYKRYLHDDDTRKKMKSVGMEGDYLMLSNEGQAFLLSEDGKQVALIACQSDFKRGKGHLSECEERDANAARLSLCWNCHDSLVEALSSTESAINNLISRMENEGGQADKIWLLKELKKQNAEALKSAKGE